MLLIEPFAFLTFSLPSLSSDLVQLGHSQTPMLRETVFVTQKRTGKMSKAPIRDDALKHQSIKMNWRVLGNHSLYPTHVNIINIEFQVLKLN